MPKGTQRINGTDYVYDYTSVWNSEKQRSEQKRVYIGKNVNGVFIPNKSYALTQKLQEVRQEKKTGPVPVLECKRLFYGATYLLDEIGKKLGVTEDLKSCFPDTYQQILSLVYFTILEEGLPFYRFAKWSYSHRHPWGENIPSQRSSELLGAITEEKKMNFFRRQSKRRSEQEYLAFDTTSISSYAEMIRQVKYGKNKERPLGNSTDKNAENGAIRRKGSY